MYRPVLRIVGLPAALKDCAARSSKAMSEPRRTVRKTAIRPELSAYKLTRWPDESCENGCQLFPVCHAGMVWILSN